MVLENLGSNLYKAIQKVIRAPVVDEATVKELVRDFQRALLQADVNVALVMELSQNIQKKTLKVTIHILELQYFHQKYLHIFQKNFILVSLISTKCLLKRAN